ncbi:MAG: hypothetical protein Tsb005_20980 [Gammaproteobacteria bacterium]
MYHQTVNHTLKTKLALTMRGSHLFIGLSLVVLSRLIPHPANVTPLTSVSWLTGRYCSRIPSILFITLALLLSDSLLSLWYGYPLWGYWSWFTYSGFVGVVWCGRYIPGYLIGVCSIGYWLWTNFGVWLTSNMYVHSINGLITCYIAGLPFLRNALVGDYLWLGVWWCCAWQAMRKINYAT